MKLFQGIKVVIIVAIIIGALDFSNSQPLVLILTAPTESYIPLQDHLSSILN